MKSEQINISRHETQSLSLHKYSVDNATKTKVANLSSYSNPKRYYMENSPSPALNIS